MHEIGFSRFSEYRRVYCILAIFATQLSSLRLRHQTCTRMLEIGLDHFTLLLQPHSDLYQEYTQIMDYPPT